MRADIYIGIDPDTHLNGIGRLDMAGRKATATNLPFALTIDYVRDVIKAAHRVGQKVAVIVECSWGEAHNWHLKFSDSKAVAAKKGYAVGVRCTKRARNSLKCWKTTGLRCHCNNHWSSAGQGQTGR